jgi:hypothetical protein
MDRNLLASTQRITHQLSNADRAISMEFLDRMGANHAEITEVLQTEAEDRRRPESE